MSEIPKWQASIHFLYPGEATSGRTAVYLAADVDVAIAAAEQRVRMERLRDTGNGIKAIGHYEGLREAREAVAQLPRPLTKTAALAAIDALRGES